MIYITVPYLTFGVDSFWTQIWSSACPSQWHNFKFCSPPLQKTPCMGPRPGDMLELSAKITFFQRQRAPLTLRPHIVGLRGQ